MSRAADSYRSAARAIHAKYLKYRGTMVGFVGFEGLGWSVAIATSYSPAFGDPQYRFRRRPNYALLEA